MREEGFLTPYRILDLADEKGAFCGKILADLGADVIKIEPPRGDGMRRRGPFFHDEIHPEKGLYFLYFNTNKRSITLNIEHTDGQAIFKELTKKADAIIETFPVGYLKQSGLDYEVLSKINPGIVMCSITPYGQTGPDKYRRSSDLISMATSGLAQITGEPYEPPVRLGNEQSHYPPAQYGALATVAALYYRDNISGRGQYIDISMQEALITYYLENHPVLRWRVLKENPGRPGRISDLGFPMGVYPCKDGWVALGVASPQEWEAFSRWVYEANGNKQILEEKYKMDIQARNDDRLVLEPIITDFISRYHKEELFHEGQRRNLVLVPANTIENVLTDSQLEEIDFWVELEHPMVGKLRYPLGIFAGDIKVRRKAAPLLGEHNEEIYCGELGFSKAELTILRGSGVI